MVNVYIDNILVIYFQVCILYFSVIERTGAAREMSETAIGRGT